jgi:hypothetical protein
VLEAFLHVVFDARDDRDESKSRSSLSLDVGGAVLDATEASFPCRFRTESSVSRFLQAMKRILQAMKRILQVVERIVQVVREVLHVVSEFLPVVG